MLEVQIRENRVFIGERFSVSFQRTLRIPDDGRVYPLPPGLGAYPVHRVADYKDSVPDRWNEHEAVFVPMYQREALWLGLSGTSWKPNAVKIGVGKINAVSGEAWDQTLNDDPQDYLVCPHQPWLDGINAGDGLIRQFVAMPVGHGYTVEAQLTGEEKIGGIQVIAFEPHAGKFPDEPPPGKRSGPAHMSQFAKAPQPAQMGLAAGGRMRQKIYPDPYGIDTWNQNDYGALDVYLINSEQYHDITGLRPPATPISAQTYTEYGFPWFDLYDESQATLAASAQLNKVRTVREKDALDGTANDEEDKPFEIDDKQIKILRRPE
jgi:hypothetical protein